ncbi:MAG: hypothetical protein E4H44_04870 [Candidatus Aminicenantes bacterium]|nr:MAG: hypothetical protein E4H44_04870 [Candidatus Aminicenantes bacterium]
MRIGTLVLLTCLAAAAPAAAQDPTGVPTVTPDSLVPPPLRTDSATSTATAPSYAIDSVPVIRAPLTPMGAFFRSLLIPGWGQAKLGRKTAGAFFLAAEGVTLGMVLTTSSQLNYLEEINSGSVDSKQQQYEDWLVLLGLNHLLSAMEAYVSAHLWDFPGDLSIQAAPNGGVAGAVSVPVRLR